MVQLEVLEDDDTVEVVQMVLVEDEVVEDEVELQEINLLLTLLIQLL